MKVKVIVVILLISSVGIELYLINVRDNKSNKWLQGASHMSSQGGRVIRTVDSGRVKFQKAHHR